MTRCRYRRDAWPSATFRLRAGNNRLRFCGADVSPSAAGTIQTNSVVTTGGGNQPGDPLASANLTAVTNAGVAIAPADYLGNGNAPGVLAFEAADVNRLRPEDRMIAHTGFLVFCRHQETSEDFMALRPMGTRDDAIRGVAHASHRRHEEGTGRQPARWLTHRPP